MNWEQSLTIFILYYCSKMQKKLREEVRYCSGVKNLYHLGYKLHGIVIILGMENARVAVDIPCRRSEIKCRHALVMQMYTRVARGRSRSLVKSFF